MSGGYRVSSGKHTLDGQVAFGVALGILVDGHDVMIVAPDLESARAVANRLEPTSVYNMGKASEVAIVGAKLVTQVP